MTLKELIEKLQALSQVVSKDKEVSVIAYGGDILDIKDISWNTDAEEIQIEADYSDA